MTCTQLSRPVTVMAKSGTVTVREVAGVTAGVALGVTPTVGALDGALVATGIGARPALLWSPPPPLSAALAPTPPTPRIAAAASVGTTM